MKSSLSDFMGSLNNQTNLALKGILGMGAYSELCHLAGDLEGEAYYKVFVLPASLEKLLMQFF